MTDSVFLPPYYPLLYRAVGLVHGRYLPSKYKKTRGTLLTDDGALLPANLIDQVGWKVKFRPEEILGGERFWSVYPRTDIPAWFERVQAEKLGGEDLLSINPPEPPKLWLQLRGVREPRVEQTEEDLRQGNNYFSIRGEIMEQDNKAGQIVVRICRNKVPQDKERRLRFQPFLLRIDGYLPGKVKDQFWDLDVSLDGDQLLLENGTFVADLTPPPDPEPPPAKKKKGKGKGQQKKAQAKKVPPKPESKPPKPPGTGRIIRLT